MKNKIIFVPICILLLISISASRDNQPLVINELVLHSGNRTFDNVEQQGFIVNDTGCPWDPDDDISGSGGGYLNSGQSASVSACVIISENQEMHAFILTVSSTKLPTGATDFIASITFDYGSNIYRVINNTPIPWFNGIKSYGTVMRSRTCATTTYPSGSPTIVPVGSYGGVGAKTIVTYTVTNNSPRREYFNVKAEISASLANEPQWEETLCDGVNNSPEPWFDLFSFSHPYQSSETPWIYWIPGNLEVLK